MVLNKVIVTIAT